MTVLQGVLASAGLVAVLMGLIWRMFVHFDDKNERAHTAWGVGPAPGAVAAADLAGDHRGPDGVFGPPVGGVEGRVAQEEEHGLEFAGQVPGEALGGGQRRRGVDEPAEPGFEPAAGRREAVLADAAGVAAGPQGEGVLQDRLHGGGPGAVGMIGPQDLQRRSSSLLRAILHASAHGRRTCMPFRGFSGHDPVTQDE